jgi:predicted nucleotidyltransferase
MENQLKLEDFGTLILKGAHGSVSQGTAIGIDDNGNVLPGYENNPFTSDYDVSGIYIPHKKFLLGTRRKSLYPLMDSFDEWSDPAHKDHKYTSLPKFAKLLYDCNPNITEQLFIRPQHILYINQFGRELLDMAPMFITKRCFNTFAAYAYDQAKLMARNHNHSGRGKATSHAHYFEKSGGNFDLKAYAHLLRLMFHLKEMLTEGTLSTYLREADRQMVIRVKHHGLHPWLDIPLTLEEAQRIAEELFVEVKELMLVTTIPDEPDFERFNSWVVDVIERANGGVVLKHNYASTAFHILPLEQHMVEHNTLLLVSNPLSKRMVKSDAFGICVPYMDFYTGLREFQQFSFDKTKIDSVHKALDRMENCNPTLIDMVFASQKHVLHEQPAAAELREKFKTLITTPKLVAMTLGVVRGNINEMIRWENKKAEWEKLRLAEPEKKFSKYPPCDAKTDPEDASYIHRYGYNTVNAAFVFHVLSMAIELIETGSLVDSRRYEPEMILIKEGFYDSYESFEQKITNMLTELEKVKMRSKLPEVNNAAKTERWLIAFIEQYHQSQGVL